MTNCLDSHFFFISSIRYHEHEVDDDVVTCETVQDEKCEDVTQGYTTEQKCTKWPREVCTQETQTVLKYSPETDCRKVPRDLCGPSGCVLQPGPEECFDKKETIISEVLHIKYIHLKLYKKDAYTESYLGFSNFFLLVKTEAPSFQKEV